MKKAALFFAATFALLVVSDACSFEGVAEAATPIARSSIAVTEMGGKTNPQRTEVLFAVQIATLRARGVPEAVVASLERQREEVLAVAATLFLAEGRVLFLPVIPLSVMDASRQMATVDYYGSAGVNRHLTASVADVDDLFSDGRPYYIFDVEDGSATLGHAPFVAAMVWAESKDRRRGLSLAESIALVRHGQASVLSRHAVWAVGSRYEFWNQVPLIHLENGQPSLDWGDADYEDMHIGAPSCGIC